MLPAERCLMNVIFRWKCLKVLLLVDSLELLLHLTAFWRESLNHVSSQDPSRSHQTLHQLFLLLTSLNEAL